MNWYRKAQHPTVAHSRNDSLHCGITFGDHPFASNPKLRDKATFVAFTAAGLAKLDSPQTPDGLLATFPNTFNLGMANRSNILGDFEESTPKKWRWKDADYAAGSSGLATADAVILIYANSEKECKTMLSRHVDMLGGKDCIVHEIYTQPAEGRIEYERRPAKETEEEAKARREKAIDYEHFGFHDGLSQPVIRGTQRFAKGALPRDIVEPGEFILGYRNNQKYYPPTPTVSAETDPDDLLPTPLTDIPSRFPSFEDSDTVRDFGRNGSFLVIRQLAQDVEEFKKFTEDKAKELRDSYDQGRDGAKKLADVVGADIDFKWVAAKMMGRWPDGVSLIARPGADKGEDPRKRDHPDNDFSYEIDDPQGLHCPFGSHIRRANPRDSMQPEDPMQQPIINRHRLLRRGRTYDYQPPEETKKEKGLLFTCLCADLDRQFEFVQQSWIGSPSFHGLKNEADPIASWQNPDWNSASLPFRRHRVPCG